MNNDTTARQKLRVTEMSGILQLNILGLLTSEGQATDKLLALQTAREKEDAGEVLSMTERKLLDECASVIAD